MGHSIFRSVLKKQKQNKNTILLNLLLCRKHFLSSFLSESEP